MVAHLLIILEIIIYKVAVQETTTTIVLDILINLRHSHTSSHSMLHPPILMVMCTVIITPQEILVYPSISKCLIINK